MIALEELGWNEARADWFASSAAPGLLPGRVIGSGGQTIAATADGEVEVVIQRGFRRSVGSAADMPVVGDWVALERVAGPSAVALLREVLPRTSRFSRGEATDGRRESHGAEQVVAANVNLALLVTGLDNDFNVRRMERYLTMAWSGGSRPVVVLNKSDLLIDPAEALARVAPACAGVSVQVVSAREGTGMSELRALIGPGLTACLLGSSGVGKSTITNALLGEDRQAVRALREDDGRGRHTTTRRELFKLPAGGLLIDTPGLRSVGLTDAGDGLELAFGELAELATGCRFSDCRHEQEPGCEVRAAIARGSLSEERLASFRKLELERRTATLRSDVRARRAAERRLGRMYRESASAAERRRRGTG